MADISKIALPSGDTYNLKDSNALHSISGTSPISVSGSVISHANSGVTAASKGDTTDQTPTWGGTFKVPSGTVNVTGHLTEFAEHTVMIPDSLASGTTNGLMSSDQYMKLYGLPDGEDIKSTQLVDAVTGNIATKSDARANEKVVELTANIAPSYKGTGTIGPTNPRPLIGYTDITVHQSKKNLFDKNNYTKLAISSTAASGTTNGTVTGVGYTVAWMNLPGGRTYAISCSTHSSKAFRIVATAEYPVSTTQYKSPCLLTISDSSASTILFNAPADMRWIGFALYSTTSTDVTNIDDAVVGLQVEIASESTTYEAFSGDHQTIQFPTGAGTVYGATLNVTSGILSVTHAIKTFDGTEAWEIVGSGDNAYFKSSINVQPYGTSDYGWSSHFDYKPIRATNDYIGIGSIISGTPFIVARPGDSIATTAAEMQTWCAAQNTAGTPLQVVFPLLTPIEYQADPVSFTMSEGLNHFWSSANGTTTVKCVSTVGWGFADAILASISSAQGVSF